MNRSEKFWNMNSDAIRKYDGELMDSIHSSQQVLPVASYWHGDGRYECYASELAKLIPVSGRVKNPRKNKHLEHYRVVCNAYYDLYNNGGWNRPSQIYQYAGKRSVTERYVYVALEIYLDYVILAAYAEQFGLDMEVRNVA
tara:strand:- start:32121 stop:32543 length:423 start_codon:yes stop_codon:yes gene_type:complete